MEQHDFNLKMAKVLILILVFSVMVIIVSGMDILRNNFYFNWRFLDLEWSTVQARIAWLRSGGNVPVNPSTNQAKLIPVLVYHGVIADPNWRPDGVNVSVGEFRDQMFALERDGWETITMKDYLDFVQGKKQLPEKSFLLTFDDGRKDSYYNGDPILQAVGYNAVMFVITGRSLGPGNETQPFHLSRIELQKMAVSGHWEMGSHTQNGHGTIPIDAKGDQGHFLSNLMWLPNQHRLETVDEYKKRVTDDLLAARGDIEEELGVQSPSFAYPYGDLGQGSSNFPEGQVILADIVKSIYSVSFVQTGNNDFISNSADDAFLSKRIGIDQSISPARLVTMLDDSHYKPLDFEDNFLSNAGWLRAWGSLKVGGGRMLVGTSKEDDSASTFLSGSSLWKNYFFTAKIKVIKGDSFELVAYKDGNDYAACDYSGNWAALTQEVGGGHDQEIATATLKNAVAPGVALDAGLKIDGNQVTCYLDSQPIISGDIASSLDRRGIGFKTWDAKKIGSEFAVTDLKVSQEK